MLEILEDVVQNKRKKLKESLLKSGFVLLDDKESTLITRIKGLIVEMIHYSDELPKVNYSDYISEKMSYGYNYLTNIFSDVKGITIQHFIILHKIKKIKELLIYDELNITNLSQRLHYSSVVHFSNQFIKSYRTNPYLFWQV